MHLCFGYAAVVKTKKPTGYAFLPQLADSIAQQISIEAAQPKLDLSDPNVETPDQVAGRILAGLKYLKPERLLPAPDCGMKYLARATASGKLKALSEGARLVRAELV